MSYAVSLLFKFLLTKTNSRPRPTGKGLLP